MPVRGERTAHPQHHFRETTGRVRCIRCHGNIDADARVIAQAAPDPRGLRRRFRSGAVEQLSLAGRGLVQTDGSSDKGDERLLIDLIVLVEVDRAPCVAFEA